MVRPLPILALLGALFDCRGDPPAQESTLTEEFRAAQIQQTEVEARSVHSATEMYLLQSARCPTGIEELVSSKIVAKLPVDPWDRPYVVECRDAGASIMVISLGPDGQRASADDIVVETHEF